ncbi:portal protein [Oceaniglobus trochenteri]|uniref:portal protein n=1 Tax=Oceaniglobus trochenteri TaxID=2763260 RepID=UPI001CFFF55E|nr:portal protein [Oceaniglobus trochenteri]
MFGQDSALARHIIDRFEELKTERNRRAEELDMIARLYQPQRQGFRGESRDQWNLHKLFNSTTLVSASNATASLYSTLCNPANRWFQATSGDDDLDQFHSVAAWNDIVTRRMLASFRPSVSNFYQSAVSWTADDVILGTGIMVSDEAPQSRSGRRIIDTCVSPADAVFGVDAWGISDELIVERRLDPVQAARFYGAENLPEAIREKAVAGKRDVKTSYLQAMQPNDAYTPGKLGVKGKPYVSTHVCVEGRAVTRQGGQSEQSFAIARWMVDGQESWGRGLGYLNLASGTKLQAQERDNLQAGALAARPPIGTTGSKASRRDAQLAPGKFLHGAVSYTGQQLVRPIFTHQGLPVTIDMVRATKEEVENGWHAALLSLVGRTGLGNLEVIERMEERLRLQAPYLGRMQTEGLAPVLERRFSILWRAGQIPPPPQEMKGKPLEMRFTSVAAMAQKAQEGVAVSRLLEDASKLAAVHPDPQSVWDNVDEDGAIQVLAEARGVPAGALRSIEDRKALREGRAKAQQAEQAMAVAQQGASIAKDAAAAGPGLQELMGGMA